MHGDHDVFVQGMTQSRRLRLTFFGDELDLELVRHCGPLHYCEAKPETHESECYYLWDFEAEEGYNFKALSASQIVNMELTDDTFSLKELCGLIWNEPMSTNKPLGGKTDAEEAALNGDSADCTPGDERSQPLK